jgi:hypothetical protein
LKADLDQRAEHLRELHRAGGPVDRDRVAVVHLVAGRRAGRQVDEEVALQEDARPDLRGRVGVDRPAPVADGERDRRRQRAGARVLDLLDLADLDAGDPHRRAGVHAARVADGHLDRVRVVHERDVLAEAEERHDGDDRQDDGADGERAAAAAPHHGITTGGAMPPGSAVNV